MSQRTDRNAARAVLRWLPALLWAGVIFAGSSLPGSMVPGRFGNLGHFLEYSVLGALVTRAVGREGDPFPDSAAWATLALCALYAFSDEFHQSFVPLRTPDPLDWALDVLGASVGIAAMLLRRAKAATRRPSQDVSGQASGTRE